MENYEQMSNEDLNRLAAEMLGRYEGILPKMLMQMKNKLGIGWDPTDSCGNQAERCLFPVLRKLGFTIRCITSPRIDCGVVIEEGLQIEIMVMRNYDKDVFMYYGTGHTTEDMVNVYKVRAVLKAMDKYLEESK